MFSLAHASGIYLRRGDKHGLLGEQPSLLNSILYAILALSPTGWFTGLLFWRAQSLLAPVLVHAAVDAVAHTAEFIEGLGVQKRIGTQAATEQECLTRRSQETPNYIGLTRKFEAFSQQRLHLLLNRVTNHSPTIYARSSGGQRHTPVTLHRQRPCPKVKRIFLSGVATRVITSPQAAEFEADSPSMESLI